MADFKIDKNLLGIAYYSSDYTDNSYVQKKYVDDKVQPHAHTIQHYKTFDGNFTDNNFSNHSFTADVGFLYEVTFMLQATYDNESDIFGANIKLNGNSVAKKNRWR